MSVAENMAFRELRPAALRRRRLVAQARRSFAQQAERKIAQLPGQDPLARRADRRRCPAATCSAPCWRASSAARSMC